METATCVCEKEFEVEPPVDVNLDEDPGMLESILEGNFMVYTCPECGSRLKLEFPVRISSKSRCWDIYFIPEKNRQELYRSELSFSIPTGSRCVVGYAELVEKLKLLQEELDERAVEVIKYHLLTRALQSGEEEEPIRILFVEKSAEGLVFHIHGLRKDEVGVSRIRMDIYHKAKRSLDETAAQEPMKSLLEPPYVSVNKAYKEADS